MTPTGFSLDFGILAYQVLQKGHMVLHLGESQIYQSAETMSIEGQNCSDCESHGMVDIEVGSDNKLTTSDGISNGDKAQPQYTHIVVPSSGHKRYDKPGTDQNKKDEDRREAPIFCAICLKEYKIQDEVSWSTNADCTHVFHRKCISQWCVTLLKRNARTKVITQTRTKLECPMCRQEFLKIQANQESV